MWWCRETPEGFSSWNCYLTFSPICCAISDNLGASVTCLFYIVNNQCVRRGAQRELISLRPRSTSILHARLSTAPQEMQTIGRFVGWIELFKWRERPNHKCLLWVISLSVHTGRSRAEKNSAPNVPIWISLLSSVPNII